MTDEIAAELRAADQRVKDARAALEQALDDRDAVVRKHRQSGVEPRDIAPILGVTRQQVGRMVNGDRVGRPVA